MPPDVPGPGPGRPGADPCAASPLLPRSRGHVAIRGVAMSDAIRSATFSPCRRYRYRLERVLGPGPVLQVIGLNPSTADEVADDPTVRRCKGFARHWGFGRLILTNLFGLRA